MRSTLFFLFLVFQVICLASTPVLADSQVPETQQANAEDSSPVIIAPYPVDNKGFFARLAEGFRNLVKLFRGESQKAQEKADQYQEKADMYASDAENQPEDSWFGRILQGLANMYNKAASLWRKKADTDERRADSYQEQADHYGRLAGEEDTNKEREMAKCFSDLVRAYGQKKKINLIANGAEQVACDSHSFSEGFGIWWASLPNESDARCFAFNANEGIPPTQQGMDSFSLPPSGASLTEAEKQAKLDACHNKLNNVLEETMKSCWQKSGNVLADLERQRLLDSGVDYNSIQCSAGAVPSDIWVWHIPVESRVSCWIGMGGAFYGEKSSPSSPITTSAKQDKLSACVGLYSENSNLLRGKGIGSVPKYVGECLKDKAQAVDNRLKETLRIQGVSGPYQCNSPESYSITYTGTMVTAHGVGGCQGSVFRINRVMTHTVQCPLPIAVVDPPIEIVDESWDACIQRNMQEAKRTLLQGSTAGIYTCSGKYGSERGWSVTCSSKSGIWPIRSTGYQPYPAICNSLPRTAVASYPKGSE